MRRQWAFSRRGRARRLGRAVERRGYRRALGQREVDGRKRQWLERELVGAHCSVVVGDSCGKLRWAINKPKVRWSGGN